SVEGNTYLSVPILGFGSENGEGADNGEERMPWLSTLHPFGDTSDLTRFVIGLDGALRDYRGMDENPPFQDRGSSTDPWREDLFYRRVPFKPSAPVQENNEATKGVSPQAIGTDPNQQPLRRDRCGRARFGDERRDQPGVLPMSAAARTVSTFKA